MMMPVPSSEEDTAMLVVGKTQYKELRYASKIFPIANLESSTSPSAASVMVRLMVEKLHIV